ncbi:hypothetical protein ABW19_dt0204591 [Dactylella cylindrospora]|nr:hypothetical protein ABW19_dt0204591 [Dactylella cylindrospora]
MADQSNNPDDFYLDTFGQQGLNIYTQICQIYAITDPSSYDTISPVLTAGLKRLSANFPWVAGHVVKEGASEGNGGDYKIEPLEDMPSLTLKDLRDNPSAPTMTSLRQQNFPFRLLDESIIAPATTLPLPGRDPIQRVILLQATIITGGVIVTFLGHHAVMDGIGQGEVMRLLSKACRNDTFAPEEIRIGNLPRRHIIPTFNESYKPGPELAHQIVPSPPPLPSDPITPPKSTWAYCIFSSPSLAGLKAAALSHLTSGYVSTDDVLTALIWQSVTRSRLSRIGPDSKVTFARAVDVRRYIGIPATYTGLAQNMTYHSFSAKELVEAPLGVIASDFRAAIDPKTSTLEYATKSYATYVERTSDKSSINLTATFNLSTDIMLSSWAKFPCYELDFGLGLGPPEAVRRPQFTPLEGLMYLMPRKPDGEIALALCLRDEDLKSLSEDHEFTKYGAYVI